MQLNWRAMNARKRHQPYETRIILAATILEAYTYPRARGHFITELLPNVVPPLGWIKVNTEGSLLPSCKAGLGVVIHNSHDEFIATIGHHTEHWDNTHIEHEAMFFVELHVEPLMYEANGIIIEGDNKCDAHYL
ncbi:hypothetical protein IEQ34_014774 [Dendrobium chrysotoxum]|uniref:RNase H type-1 domain-containing protein n=1 Tax=Dendrobium chrysotoxum TaxID=161865 RepID=A0AAV7GKU4_DENCH|nr:hypothetical protein IEQ34_014774 [Dendrobium chrysotoxum]